MSRSRELFRWVAPQGKGTGKGWPGKGSCTGLGDPTLQLKVVQALRSDYDAEGNCFPQVGL